MSPAAIRANQEIYDEVVSLYRLDVTPGGIDFDPALYELVIKRDANGVPLPVYQQPLTDIQMKIQGFTPIILDISPVTNLPLLLGAAADDGPQDEQGNDYSCLSPMDRERTV